MPTLNCYAGPAFSLAGERYYPTALADISVTLDDPAEAADVLAAQWYLDGSLIRDNNALSFSATVGCGTHTIGVRLLSSSGWSGFQTHRFDTCKTIVSVNLTGPEVIEEGSYSRFYVIRGFSDGSTEDITKAYTFLASGHGYFINNKFTAYKDDSSFESYSVDISAVRNGIVELQKTITVLNTTPVVVATYVITGPSFIDERGTAIYGVTAQYSNGSQSDVSGGYTFSSNAGSFEGRVFTAPLNPPGDVSQQVRITATPVAGGKTLTRDITVGDMDGQAGILVVDLFNFPSLNVIGYVGSSGSAYGPAYTGHNVEPAGSSIAEALILASDYINQPTLNWRFEFNLSRLLNEQPGTNNFIFYIKGRGISAGAISGAFVLKSLASHMTMNGSPGTYLPSVAGGNNIRGGVNFSSSVSGGANGDYSPAALPTILKLNYDVVSKSISFTTS